jgi:hypothetical protein
MKIALMRQVVRTSETLVYSYETTRSYIPESCHLHGLRVSEQLASDLKRRVDLKVDK